MPLILRKLPYFDNETSVTFPGERGPILVKGSQAIVWVVLTRIADFSPLAPSRFPAILDTGFSQNLAIGAQQLSRWAGLTTTDLAIVGFSDIHEAGLSTSKSLKIPRHKARAWLHRNEAGLREPLLSAPPFDLQIDGGITI